MGRVWSVCDEDFRHGLILKANIHFWYLAIQRIRDVNGRTAQIRLRESLG